MNVLISGGTGLIGRTLTKILIREGFEVGILTRSFSENQVHRQFIWNIESGEIDNAAIPWADHIVHLTGESVGQRWTKSTKQKIIASRIKSTKLLVNELSRKEHKVKSFISGSAIGIYGKDTGDKLINEQDRKGQGFLAEVVYEWEQAIDPAQEYVESLVKLRTGVVFSKSGGALEKIKSPIEFGIGSPLGNGKQWISWIHIEDLCEMILFAITNKLSGVYNGVAPEPVTNEKLTKVLAKKLKRPLFLPNVPEFILKMVLGEMSEMILGGNRVEPMAFQKEGYKFEYNTLEEAVTNLI